MRFPDSEWRVRCDLAAFYRLFAHNGWTDLLATHITARVPDQPDTYLIAPCHLLFEEVSASSLIQVHLDGTLLTKTTFNGTSPSYSKAGHAIHVPILLKRPDVNFIAHTHTRATVAVSALSCGLQPFSQQAIVVLSSLAYHRYGGRLTKRECDSMANALGDKYAMLLQNHGTLAVGRTPGEAYLWLHWLEEACSIQLDIMSCSNVSPVIPDDDAILGIQHTSGPTENPKGAMVWEAQRRMLYRLDPKFAH